MAYTMGHPMSLYRAVGEFPICLIHFLNPHAEGAFLRKELKGHLKAVQCLRFHRIIDTYSLSGRKGP